MDRRDTKSLWRDYGVPMQDPNAFSLQYGKDTTKDPSKAGKTKLKKPNKDWLKDKTGLLKIVEAKAMQEGGKITKLDPDREKNFQSWYKRTSKELGLDPDPDSYQHYYDYRGYYAENGDAPMTAGQHFTDKYKLPGHPTFSVESKYANFSNKDKQGYWATMEQGKGVDNFVKLSDSKLPIKENGGILNNDIMIGLFKKGGKVGDPKNREKAGGSNVGKYSKSEGPFAGPSGGAPKGSYPIGSKARGKSALKLAHNAPNPAGIKAAVYRKYPDLKKKAYQGAKLGLHGEIERRGMLPPSSKRKAYKGAKLGLLGMGAMQYQEGTPPKHKGLLKKKKK